MIIIEPIFRPQDPQGVSFLHDEGLRALRAHERLAPVLEPKECSLIAAAVDRELANVIYYQDHPYAVVAIEAGPYYFIAVEERPNPRAIIAQSGRTRGMVLERTSSDVVADGWLF